MRRQLTFAEQVRKLCRWMSGLFNFHSALGGTIWELHTSDCREIYIANVCSMLEYADAAWVSWLSASSSSKLEKVQLEAARDITGIIRSTTVVAVLTETQMPPISTRFQTISLLQADELVRLPRSALALLRIILMRLRYYQHQQQRSPRLTCQFMFPCLLVVC